MMYVDLTRLPVSTQWREQAERATGQLLDLRDEERVAFLQKNSWIWQDLKPALEELSGGKCWYCEGKISRFDYHVDHYRPKNKVKNRDGTERPGYWWLAFDHRNFRFSCGYCNCGHATSGGTRGKANQFPLAQGSVVASSPDLNVEDEVPLLLDPTRSSDPLLLWFLDNGEACPSCPDGLPHQRAEETIVVLNLNYYKTVDERRNLWNEIIGIVEHGNRAYEQYRKGSAVGYQEFEYAIKDLRRRIAQIAPYSAAARACLMGIAYPWVRAVLV